MKTHTHELNARDLGKVIEFEDPIKAKVYTIRAILKSVMHDEKGTFIRYRDLLRPTPIEYAHYIDPDVTVTLSDYQEVD